MLKATYTIDAEELRETMRSLERAESREDWAPWLLKWFMGKGRPRYRWQVWLSNHWPTKEIPKERRLSTLMANEMTKAINEEVLREIERDLTNRP